MRDLGFEIFVIRDSRFEICDSRFVIRDSRFVIRDSGLRADLPANEAVGSQRDPYVMPPNYGSFENLDCWKAGRELRLYVAASIIPTLPKEERYRLGDQLLRAARSVTANIAEGHGRFHYLDNAKFCRNARGSCSEVLDHLITAHDENFISPESLSIGRAKVEKALRVINGYIGYLTRAAGPGNAQFEIRDPRIGDQIRPRT